MSLRSMVLANQPILERKMENC